jgi:hypothetical protein
MATNPYAQFLGDVPAWEVIEETVGKLKFLLDKLGQRAEMPPSPEKWSARQIVCHLADCEIVFTPSPRQFAEAGWLDARLLAPDILPLPPSRQAALPE